MELDPIKNIKIEHKILAKKKNEHKMIGNTRRKRGLFLFAYNHERKEVYQIKLQKNEAITYDKKKISAHRAYVNPNHRMLWALNLKNAVRKFNRLLKL